MRIRYERIALGLLAATLFILPMSACAPDDPTSPAITGGAIPATRVVAVGNSLTAGFTNEALFLEGQLSGYANLVSRAVTGADMTMPLVAAPGLASSLNTSGPTPIPQGQLYVSATGALAYRQLSNPADVTGLLLAAALPNPYDNLGVPGAYAGDVASATSSANSIRPSNLFFDLILRNSALPPGGTTQLSQLEAVLGSSVPATQLLMVWVGSNDILLGTLGGDPVVGTNLTTVADYETTMDEIFDTIDAYDVPQVVVINIPSVTSVPSVTAVGALLAANSLTPADITTDEADVAAILLTAQPLLFPGGAIDADYLSGAKSLPSTLTLTNAEIAASEGVRAGYNSYLQDATSADGRDWAYVDIAAVLAALPLDPAASPNALFALLAGPGGLIQNEGSAFGLDGVHPSQKGYARVANTVLTALNATYGTSYSTYDLATIDNTLGFEEFTGPVTRETFAVQEGQNPFQNLIDGLGARR